MADVELTVKRVPETMSAEIFKNAGGDGSRQPDARELTIARHQGAYVAKIAAKLKI